MNRNQQRVLDAVAMKQWHVRDILQDIVLVDANTAYPLFLDIVFHAVYPTQFSLEAARKVFTNVLVEMYGKPLTIRIVGSKKWALVNYPVDMGASAGERFGSSWWHGKLIEGATNKDKLLT